MGYIDVNFQIVTFLLSISLGVVLCLFYDIVRVMHKLFAKGFFEVFIIDLLFWVLASFLTFCFLIIRCQGTVRGYVLFGALIGFIAVRLTISKIFLIVFEKFYCFSRKIINLFVLLFKFLVSPLCKIVKKIQILTKKVLQDKVILLYNHFKLIIVNVRRSKNGCSD